MSDENPLEPVSIEASLTESGVSLSTKSRFVSALDRMFGGLFAIPAAFLEERAARVRLQAELDRKRTAELAELELAGELKLKQIELAADCIAKGREARRLLNLASVAQIAIEDLRDHSSASDAGTAASEISDDWLNWFQDFAEKASSESVRTLWGKILAGEARKPGRFSIGTLRTLAEIDHDTALLFQKHIDHLLWDQYIIKPENLEGLELLELTALEDAGLLREVNGVLGFDQKFPADGKLDFEQGGAVLELEAPEGTSFRISVILLSRAGRELFSVLHPPPADAALRRIVELVPASVTSATLGVLVDRSGGQFRWRKTEVIRGNATPDPGSPN